MTSTELIACTLFGWKAADSKEFVGPHGARVAVEHDRAFDIKPCSTYAWPDLADWNWIRRMEDSLSERGLWSQYCHELCNGRWVLITDAVTDVGELVGRATADQRVEAAVKVLEGIEREKAKKAEQLERAERRRQTVRAKAAELKKTMRCNCDLDNWVPEDISGHSHVCRIHKEAVKVLKEQA